LEKTILNAKSADNIIFKEKLALAAKSYNSGNINKADTLYSEILKHYHNSAELFMVAGKIAGELEDYSRAIDLLSKATIINPNNAVTLFLLGKNLLKNGKASAAKRNLGKAVLLNPELHQAWCMLGDIHSDQDELESAIKIFLQVINRDKTYFAAYSKLSRVFRKQKRHMMAQVFSDLFHHYYSGPELNQAEHETQDTFFLDRNVAHATALEKNRIFQTIAVSAPQICYYQGEPFASAPDNLILVSDNEIVQFFISVRLRLPMVINFDPSKPGETTKATDIAAIFESIKPSVNEEMLQHLDLCRTQQPVFLADKPLKIFLSTSRLTTVMQYSTRDLSAALQRKGCDVRLLIEGSDLEKIETRHYIKEYSKTAPNAVININNLNNDHLHKDTYNIVWWQDPMDDLTNKKQLPWRERDLSISAYYKFDTPLYDAGAKVVYRQDHCIDPEIFSPTIPLEQRKKIVFVGSSYAVKIGIHGENGLKIIAKMQEKMALGQDITDSFIKELSKKFAIGFDDIFYDLLPFVVRDTSVEWLCSIADSHDYEVEVYGRWWDENPIVAPFFKGELPHGPMVAKIYNESKYAIAAMHRTVNSQRLAEIAACGCIPVLLDERSYPEVEPPHWNDECLFYRTKDELQKCIGRSPKNDPQIIAKSYSYDSFADKIITYIRTGSYPDQPVKKP
jgi:hypothetical protein